jgi:penicillin-binding protein 1A
MQSDADVVHDSEFDEAPPRPRWRRWLPRVGIGFCVVFVALIVWLFVTAPLGRALEPLETPALVLLDAEGEPFARRGDFKAEPVEVADLPPHVVDALLSIEDRRFYSHWGVDPQGLGRAFLANMQAGGVVQGGSTITQQLAKTSFLTMERSYWRKAQELIIALWLEAWLTKDEILSRYLSSVYFGEGAYGLRAAARTYFNRRPEKLTLAQAAMLAGIIKAPSAMAPSRHLKRAQARAEVVLAAMVENGKLSQARADAVRPAEFDPGRAKLPAGSYFADWVLPQAREALESAHFGEVRVKTTLDPDLQEAAEDVVEAALRDNGGWMNVKEAALVAMRPTGEVVAMVGGRDYATNQYNRAAQAKRQPGSAFKMFVYLAALRNGWTLDSRVDDTPDLDIEGWQPKNDEGKYRGPQISMYTAFAASSNVAAARITQAVGSQEVIRAAKDLGVTDYINPWPSMSLGTSRMTLLELTSAFAAIADGRYPVKPVGLAERQTGWKASLENLVGGQRSLPQAEDMKKLLATAVRNGTGSTAKLPITAYGKTGTTQNYRDALFVGFAGDLVVGVWVGNDDNTPMNGVTGRTLPATIWKRFMTRALPELRRPEPETAAGDDLDLDALGDIGDIDAAFDIADTAAEISGSPEAQEAVDAARAAAEEALADPQQ